MPPLPADSIHARACKLKCEKILTRPKINSEVTALSIAGIRVPEMKKAPSHLYCVLHQIHIQLFKLGQTVPNCHNQKREERGTKNTPKIGSRLSYNLTTNPFFTPIFAGCPIFNH